MPNVSADDPHRFVFELDRAILAQVMEKLETSPLLPLGKGVGPAASGIYALYFNEALVYIGKASQATTKSARTLRARLNEHVTKIQGRKGIRLADVSCRYLTFESEWYVFAAELVLMMKFAPPWNYSGFGSKTPGVGRPGTERVSTWDQQFPKKA